MLRIDEKGANGRWSWWWVVDMGEIEMVDSDQTSFHYCWQSLRNGALTTCTTPTHYTQHYTAQLPTRGRRGEGGSVGKTSRPVD
jgi:hypothetical protein